MVAHIRPQALLAVTLAALSLALPACSDSSEGSDSPVTPTTITPVIASPTPTGTATLPPSTLTPTTSPLDFNADGRVVLGVATTGPADAGGWSQNLVDAATDLSAKNDFAAPIVVDNVHPDEAATLIGGLAQLSVDMIIIGAAAIAEPLAEVIAQYPDIFWYCNCGNGIAPNEGLAQVTDNGAEIGYTAGYATGLLLKETSGRRTTVIGCCDIGLEQQSYHSFEDGLRAVDDAFRMTYVRTGELEYDFDNTVNATDAFRTAIDERTHAVLPFLDGAQRAVVQAANDAGVIVLSAGSRAVCDEVGVRFDISVGFDGGEYLQVVLPTIIDGTFLEGQTRPFKVGVDPQSGAKLCSPTPDQQATMDALFTRIAAGELAEQFAEVTEKAYADEVDLTEDLLD